MLNIFSAFGLSASAGLNAYIPLLVVSLLAKFTNLIELGEAWDPLTSWWTIGVLVVLGTVEFFADKIPAIDHVNNIIQTFIRPTAGAILFASSTSAVTNINPVFALILGLLTAGAVHATKSIAIRPAVTMVSGGTADAPVSFLEDLIAAGISILAVVIPVVVACILIIATSLIVMRIYRKNKDKQEAARP